MRLKLKFCTQKPLGGFFREFAIYATREVARSAEAQTDWQPLFTVWCRSTEGLLKNLGSHLRLEGQVESPEILLEASLPFDDVTALRLEVPALDHTAVLSELLLEPVEMATTNIALGCPVRTSHPLPSLMPAGLLTDGLADTEARPPSANLGAAFYFEIDLKRRWVLDHLHFRFKSHDQHVTRFSQVRLELYDALPGPGVKPIWKAYQHPNGTHPMLTRTEVREVIRADAGKGIFAGRYLRIFSDSDVPFSPQVAEVEAYPVLVSAGGSASTGGRSIHSGMPLELSAGSSWLSFQATLPKFPASAFSGSHWRIEGFHEEWQPLTASGVVESRCPRPGDYQLQVILRHTDGVWNQARLEVPLVVLEPIWQRRGVRLGAAMLIPAVLALLVSWFGTRVMTRRVAELESHNELSVERARIARDMHDAVGSQLTQLTVLHEIMADDPALPEESRTRLRHLASKARASIAALDEVVWAVNPGNDSLVNMAAYLTYAAREYLRPLGIVCRQDVPHEWPDRHVPSQIRHHIFLAFREALHNVIKHAQAQAVTITLRFIPSESLFILNIADDGIGLPSDTVGVEKDGLSNMRERLSKIGGSCRIRLRTGSGTIVEMKIPIPS